MNTKNVKAEIHRLRFEDGLTLQEIAKRFGKSIYWVNARLSKITNQEDLGSQPMILGVLKS